MPHPDTIRLMLTLGSLFMIVGLVKRPFYGLISYFIIMMIRPGLYYPILGKLRIELLVGVIIIVISLLSPDRLDRINLHKEPICKWLFIFVGVMLMSTCQAMDFKVSLEATTDFLKVVLFFLMIIMLIDNEKDFKLFIWFFIILSCVLGYEAVYNYGHGIMVESMGGNRADYAVAEKGMVAGHCAQANIILQALPFMWYLGVCQKSAIEKIAGLVLFFFGVFVLAVSASRGAMIGFAVMLILIIYYAEHKILMSIGAASILIFVFHHMGAGFQDYMGTILQGTSSGLSAESRLSGLKHGIEMMVKRPILGVGPDCYPIARATWFGWNLWAHNHYGQLMGELGILGTIAWFGFLQSYLKKALNLMRLYETEIEKSHIFRAVIVATATRLVTGMASHSLYVFVWYMFAAALALSIWPSTCADQKVHDAQL